MSQQLARSGAYLAELNTKRIEILQKALPRASRIGVRWEDPFGRAAIALLQQAAQHVGVRLKPVQVHGFQGLEEAFKTAKRSGADPVLLIWSSTFYVHRHGVTTLMLTMRLPTIALADGGLHFLTEPNHPRYGSEWVPHRPVAEGREAQ